LNLSAETSFWVGFHRQFDSSLCQRASFSIMKRQWVFLLPVTALAGMLVSCAHVGQNSANSLPAETHSANRAIQELKVRFAPDHHLAVFNVRVEPEGRRVILAGEVDNVVAKSETADAVRSAGFDVIDRITILPSPELGETTWGISRLSIANARELPGHGAELGMQILMGHVVRVLNQSNGWYLVQSADRYLSWATRGSVVRCTELQAQAWRDSPLLLVTSFEDRVMERPQPDAQPVSDVVTGCLVKKIGEEGDWFKVELPDQRTGYLQKNSATDYAEWQRTRQPTPDAIEQTARTLLGRPYLWGGNSPKGLDCSGFTKLVFFLNGVELDRNASHQAQQGTDVPLDAELSQLKKGDLVFFGARARAGRPERITHVGIYLGDKLFIHSSEMVRINSLDPNSPISDVRRIRTLIRAKRVLPDS
jgi:hypothetical protein